nr:uncharacterized protein K02A2.6-like [Nicotiana tomentosiformis]
MFRDYRYDLRPVTDISPFLYYVIFDLARCLSYSVSIAAGLDSDRFGIPESIITDNASNLNSDLMSDICKKFRIVHHNSTAYRPKMNGAVKEANMNIKRILRKIVDNHKQWHEKLSFTLLGYRITMRSSTGATPYILVYGIEDVIPAKVVTPSLRVIQEAKLDDAKWIQIRQEQLMLI